MTDYPLCPACQGENTYFDGTSYICPDCAHEFIPGQESYSTSGEDLTARDANGTALADGDNATVIKDLKVRGSSMVIKQGTKVRNLRLTDNPEEIDCKIDGTSMVLKACFLKKG